MHRLLGPLLLSAALGALPTTASAQQPVYEGPIIDVHVHAYRSLLGDRRFCFPQPCQGLRSRVSDPAELLPETLRAMEESNIVLGVTSSSWDNVRSWVEGNEDVLMPAISIGDPAARPLPMLRRLLETDSLKVLGEITSQYRGIPAGDPRLDSIYALAVEFDVPVHIHVAWPEVIPESIAVLQSADFLSADEKADIFYHNAARFFELSEEEIARHWGR